MLLLAATSAVDAFAAAADPLFASRAPLRLELEGPIRAIARDRRAAAEERDVTLRWQTPEGAAGELAIEVRARGRSRRRSDVCRFPPLRLDLPRSVADGTLFDSQDKLKLVTHCERLGSRGDAQHEWVALEFLAYRFLNVLTERSFRVRAAEIRYVQENGRAFVHPGFLIESRERLAHRLGLTASEASTVAGSAMDPDHRTLVEVFQYLIGNTDFSYFASPGDERCCHNAVQLVDGAGVHYPVPYDFDRSGLLNKPGALPARGHGIRRVIDRAFVGACREPAQLERTLALFRARRTQIDTLLAAHPALRERKRLLTQRFLEKFWATLDDEARVRRAFLDRCG